MNEFHQNVKNLKAVAIITIAAAFLFIADEQALWGSIACALVGVVGMAAADKPELALSYCVANVVGFCVALWCMASSFMAGDMSFTPFFQILLMTLGGFFGFRLWASQREM